MPKERNINESKSFRQFITKPLLITMLAIVMGFLTFGCNIGVVTNTQDFVKEFINRTLKERNGSYPSEDTLTNMWAISVAILYLGGCAGVLSNKYIVQCMSRKKGEFLSIILGFVATAVLVSSRPSEKWELFLVGRLLSGFQCGIYSGLTTTYMTEASPKEIRGSLNSFTVIGVFVGIVASQVLGFPIIFGTHDLWVYAYGFSWLPCLIQLVLLPFSVESPSYLMIILKDEAKARKALQKLRQTSDVEEEIEDLREEMKAVETVSIVQLFRHPPHRRATLLAMISQLSLQMSGIVAVLSYTNSLFQDAGLSEETAAYASISVGTVSIVMTIVVVPLAEVAGRRILHLVGHTGVIFSSIMITVCFALKSSVDGMDKASIAFVLLFVVFFSVGPAVVPFILLGDLFTQETRPSASAAALTFHWMGAFLVGYIFPPMQTALSDYVFLPFTAYVVAATIYFYFFQPETKGKTAQEIGMLFEKPDDSLGQKGLDTEPDAVKDSVLLQTKNSNVV